MKCAILRELVVDIETAHYIVMMQFGFHSLLSLVALDLAHASSTPTISWISEPVGSGETALVLGDGFSATSLVRLSTTSSWLPFQNVSLTPIANQTTPGTLKFLIPPDFALDAWAVSVVNTESGATSPEYVLNGARPWWVQGDIGDAATPGGWLRVFGLGVAAVDPPAVAIEAQLRAAVRTMTSAPTGAAGSADSLFGAAAETVAELRAVLRAASPPNCTLRLIPVGGGAAIDLRAATSNASTWSAYFHVPASIMPASYLVSVSNGRGAAGGFTPLDSFVSQSSPHVNSVLIAPPRSWPGAARFTVGVRSLPCRMPCNTSDMALSEALAAAAAAGGGTVYFPRGQYFLSKPVVIPPNTVLAGEQIDTVALYFAEYETPSGAPPAIFSLSLPQNGSATGSWGVQDLSLYVSGFHNIIFDANNCTDGFYLRRVRTRANAFFGANEEFTNTRGRWQNYTWGSNGAVLMTNARNWEVTDCDLYSTTTVISSQRPSCRAKVWPGQCHASYYGYVARNRLWNGAAAHVMNQWMQVIFEQNDISGTSLMAMGQAVGSSAGGYDHHIAVLDNSYHFVFGNDREVMTFDDAGGAYWGALSAVEGATLTIAHDSKATTSEWGGWGGGSVVVLNGTGAGQWRRIAVAGVYTDPNVTTNRTWVLDSPFTVEPSVDPAAPSFVEIMPFRGRIIFSRNHYEDVGAFQFYGHAIDVVVSENSMARGSGFLSWGQWRGWTPASATESATKLPGEAGTMGNGVQPNLNILYADNTVLEGNSWQNYNSTGGSGCGTPNCWYAPSGTGTGPNVFVHVPMESEGEPTPSATYLAVVHRRNSALSNGGMWIGEGSWNTIVENVALNDSDVCMTIDPRGVDLLHIRGTVCGSSSSARRT